MSTPTQVAANQANAQKSTGPKTEAGKAASSQNRLTHGLTYKGGAFHVLLTESQDDYQCLVADLQQDHQPQTATEFLLVEHMAQHQWLRDRAQRLQDHCFDPATGKLDDPKNFSLYLRYGNMHERAFHKCLADLLKLRKERMNEQIGFESEKRKKELHPLNVMRQEWEITRLQLHEGNVRSREIEKARREEAQNSANGAPKAA